VSIFAGQLMRARNVAFLDGERAVYLQYQIERLCSHLNGIPVTEEVRMALLL
jgi:hypothetical protein